MGWYEQDRATMVAESTQSATHIEEPIERSVASMEEPGAPKRPVNAFILFANEHREPGIGLHESNYKVREMWRNLTPEERQPWKERYEAEMKLFLDANPEARGL